MLDDKQKLNRRDFIKKTAVTTAALGIGLKSINAYAGRPVKTAAKKVIVIGIDGMDPNLTENLMNNGQLPNFAKLAKNGGYRRLGTSTPPQSPVAWANFINGAGPGSHGIFDFIHRDPKQQCMPFFSAAETTPGSSGWNIGKHKLQLDFWPFNHQPPKTVLRRQGIPFWDYLDRAKIDSVFYDLPSNYPASESKYGYHRCLSGMGTPDLLGTYGTYQHFAEDGPYRTKEQGGGMKSMVFFENETSTPPLRLIGPQNAFLKEPLPTTIEFLVHRDKNANAALIEIDSKKILLKQGQFSDWVKLNFNMSLPALMPDKKIAGICRFYLQEVSPNFRLYVTPINADPSNPAIKLTEPVEFIEKISDKLGLFYTTGFQEDHKALSNGIFSESEFANQAKLVLEERLNLLDYAFKNYDDGLLFFYFSSSDLQSHMFWWDSELKHPTRSAQEAKKWFGHIKSLYKKFDQVIGDVLAGYGDKATVMVMSDHGFANFKTQFNLNTWLRDNGYIQNPDCTSIMNNIDWSKTKAYGLGINSLYLNLKGRERDGIVEPNQQKEILLNELSEKLLAVRDNDGNSVIKNIHRTDKAYNGSEKQNAPDLIIGYRRGYRASWDTCLGDISKKIICDNDSAWSADHCADVSEVPGVLFTNKNIDKNDCSLIDLAPSILNIFGQEIPSSMEGKNIFKT